MKISSILGRILRITHEVIEYRRWIRETYMPRVQQSTSASQANDADLSSLFSTLTSITNSNTIANSSSNPNVFSLGHNQNVSWENIILIYISKTSCSFQFALSDVNVYIPESHISLAITIIITSFLDVKYGFFFR